MNEVSQNKSFPAKVFGTLRGLWWTTLMEGELRRIPQEHVEG